MFVERLPDPRKTSPGNFKEFQRSLVLRATSTKNLVCQGLKRAPSTAQIKNIKLHIVTDIKVVKKKWLPEEDSERPCGHTFVALPEHPRVLVDRHVKPS